MFTKILCPIDGSQCAERALEIARELAREHDAALTICMVAEASRAAAMSFGDPQMTALCYESLRDEAREILKNAAATTGNLRIDKQLLEGPAADAIVDFAEDGSFDVIVMGSHGRTGVARALVGSVAEAVLRRAPCPVLVVREKRVKQPAASARRIQPESVPAAG